MAPTELLAEQHFATHHRLRRRSSACAPRCSPASDAGAARKRADARSWRAGEIQLVVGTHALIQEGVRFRRSASASSTSSTASACCSAPRCAGCAATRRARAGHPADDRDADPAHAGDDGLRRPRRLGARRAAAGAQAGAHAALQRGRARAASTSWSSSELDAGRQGYVVYPLVESSEKEDLRDATTMAQRARRARCFAGYRVGLLHGRMKADEKDAVMRRFRAGDVQLLVSTTVIEVGVDVPNATVMVVEHAERFGLSQLHQLRGRVGRGSDARALPAGRAVPPRRGRLPPPEGDARHHRRLQDRRGRPRAARPRRVPRHAPAGLPDFRVANLIRDTRTLAEAREAAERWLSVDPGLRSAGIGRRCAPSSSTAGRAAGVGRNRVNPGGIGHESHRHRVDRVRVPVGQRAARHAPAQSVPVDHLGTESKDVVKLAMGLIATMAALVLGLLTASAKSSFDTWNNEIKQSAAKIILLDRTLAHYGPETKDDPRRDPRARSLSGSRRPGPRTTLRTGRWTARRRRPSRASRDRSAPSRRRTTPSARCRPKRCRSAAICSARAGCCSRRPATRPRLLFLVVLVFWLCVLFASFGLFAPRNATVIAALLFCALSVAGSTFLILEMDRPLEGMLKISSAPLRYALAHLGQ